MPERVLSRHEVQEEGQSHRSVYEEPDQNHHEVESQRSKRLESRRGYDLRIYPENADRRQPDDHPGQLHHGLKRRLEEVSEMFPVGVFELRDEITEEDTEEDDRKHLPVRQGPERIFRDDIEDQVDQALCRYLFNRFLEPDRRTDAGLQYVHQDLAGQDRHQAGYHVIAECSRPEQPEFLSPSYAYDGRREGRDDERHDRHAKESEEDVRQRFGNRHDGFAENLAGNHAANEANEYPEGEGSIGYSHGRILCIPNPAKGTTAPLSKPIEILGFSFMRDAFRPFVG